MGRPNEAIGPLERRISKIIDELIEENEALRALDKDQLIEDLSESTSNFSDAKLASVSDDELRNRLKDIMFMEAMGGLLDDLSPEQIEAFDEAVKRREFF